MKTKACWQVKATEQGISITYQNLVDNKSFDCGTAASDVPFHAILSFISTEGDPGDLVVYNGVPWYSLQKEVTDHDVASTQVQPRSIGSA